MDKLSENLVWYYREDDGDVFHTFICNYGSKSNFIKLIQSVKWVVPNWVKPRISKSTNDFHLELSEQNPNSLIYYTTERQFGNDGLKIVAIKNKN